MNKIKEILVGTNNIGKYKEICSLLPKRVIKYSPKKLNIKSPKETGKTFEENSFIKASYFSKKSNLICISDDSGLEVDILDGSPGIFSARWGGKKNNFDLAIEKVLKKMKMSKRNWEKENKARFVCSMTIFFPNGKNFTSKGIINGRISKVKKGKKGFGYDPIFVPQGYNKTFGEMKLKDKILIDHRQKAFLKLRKFFY
tara:strand:+ start:1093 stop:1689 length:597 start_codon:yes stop_codon:yes gene_type:complete